jgi:hypothetical protein
MLNVDVTLLHDEIIIYIKESKHENIGIKFVR